MRGGHHGKSWCKVSRLCNAIYLSKSQHILFRSHFALLKPLIFEIKQSVQPTSFFRRRAVLTDVDVSNRHETTYMYNKSYHKLPYLFPSINNLPLRMFQQKAMELVMYTSS